MIANFFQSLESHRVAYLLISGQATVLYGAATFSEDIDLWVEPSAENIQRFRAALTQVGARYYKLTPPLEPRYLTAGHGFHFVLGADTATAMFLDIMGRPPRSRTFGEAQRDSEPFVTDWGKLPTVGIRDLIEIKKTQRLADYPIVTALTLRLLETSNVSAETLGWAVVNLFTTESFFSFNERYPPWIESAPKDMPQSLTQNPGKPIEDISEAIVDEAVGWMATAMARHQRADRRYWRPIIDQLRKLRTDRTLMAEGAPI